MRCSPTPVGQLYKGVKKIAGWVMEADIMGQLRAIVELLIWERVCMCAGFRGGLGNGSNFLGLTKNQNLDIAETCRAQNLRSTYPPCQ